MAVGLLILNTAPKAPAGSAARAAGEVLARDPLWRVPLVPIALAATAGVALDRGFDLPAWLGLAALPLGLAMWALCRRTGRPLAAAVSLWLAAAGLAAAHHHQWLNSVPEDDISRRLADEPRLARVRGCLADEPARVQQAPVDVARPRLDQPLTLGLVEVRAVHHEDAWLPASGRVRLLVHDVLDHVHCGDEVEITGLLSRPRGPSNPGEFDVAARLRDHRIRTVLTVEDTGAAVRRLREGRWSSVRAVLAAVRGRFRTILDESLPPPQNGLAVALLLGDNASLSAEHWDRFMRTGVVHVLVVSGQQVSILALVLGFTLRRCRLSRRAVIVAVGVVVVLYWALVGDQPSVTRATAVALAAGLARWLGRPVIFANILALAWLFVAAINPADLASLGCQLSFLSIAILSWLWRDKPQVDPLDQLVFRSRPWWDRAMRTTLRRLGQVYGVSLVMWLAAVPLLAARINMVTPVAVMLSPPMIFLTSVALIAGLLMLLASLVWWPLGVPFAWVTRLSLEASSSLVDWADRLPGGHFYVPGPAPAWLLAFYAPLVALILLTSLRRWMGWFVLAGLAWLCLTLAPLPRRSGPDELRVTFLAVGHGCCVVIEPPDGRVLLCDAGAMTGPDVARRRIAPFLWHQGVRRIDEVFLSHADRDHCNALPPLLDRFAVGRISTTPFLLDRPTEDVQTLALRIEAAGVPVRWLRAGDRLHLGGATADVLHPAEGSPERVDNAHSLVLLVEHAGHRLLLTGDLEGEGLALLLSLPPTPVDVLMAPHHGGKASNHNELARWARPQVVVASQGVRRFGQTGLEVYEAAGCAAFSTWSDGAVTVRSTPGRLWVEGFRGGRRWSSDSQAPSFSGRAARREGEPGTQIASLGGVPHAIGLLSRTGALRGHRRPRRSPPRSRAVPRCHSCAARACQERQPP